MDLFPKAPSALHFHFLQQVALFVGHMSGVSGIPHDKEPTIDPGLGNTPLPLPKLLLVIPGVQAWSGMPGRAECLL